MNGAGNASAKFKCRQRALELLGRELNLFAEKKEVGKPGDFDHMADEELMEFIEAQGEVVRELERQLLPRQYRSSARMLPSTRKMPLRHGVSLTRNHLKRTSVVALGLRLG